MKPSCHLVQQAGGFNSLAQTLDYAAQGNTGLRFFNNTGTATLASTYAELRLSALRMANALAQKSLPRGSRVALLAETRLEFITLFFACQYLGLLPCPLPFTLFPAGRDAYTQKLYHLLHTTQASLLVTPGSIAPLAQAAARQLGIAMTSYEELAEHSMSLPVLDTFTPLQADEPAYIQFSSGSTASPSGILITQRAVTANITAILRAGMQITPQDKAFSWLPFYHDMGLVGFVLAPISAQVPVDYLAPAGFARRPALWLELLSTLRSTITYAPGFAYALAAKRLDPGSAIDLSALRIAGVGGDMIHAATLKAFAQRMSGHGFRFSAFAPGYGLAEATLAVTMTRPDHPPLIKQFMQTGHTRELVGCGPPLPGYEVKIVPAQPEILPEPATIAQAGEIWVKGPSIAHSITCEPSEIKADSQGYIPTGDMGFLYRDQLFITGRSKDLIIIRGRNIWAQDVEWTVASCDAAIRPQQVCAIGVPDRDEERLVVLVQNHLTDPKARAQLQQCMLQAINQTFGVTAGLIWVTPHQLILTSSGKLARTAIKRYFLANALSIID